MAITNRAERAEENKRPIAPTDHLGDEVVRAEALTKVFGGPATSPARGSGSPARGPGSPSKPIRGRDEPEGMAGNKPGDEPDDTVASPASGGSRAGGARSDGAHDDRTRGDGARSGGARGDSGASGDVGSGAARGNGTSAGAGAGRAAHGGLVAVDHLDLSVRRGEIFGLLGPNGAGKSTTIGIFTTRVIPTDGRATVAGIDVVRHPARAKRVIGVVSQANTLDRSLDVRDNLYYHGRYFGMSRRESTQRAGELLEQFHLADRAHAPVISLSGGMAQRLMVARAIFHRPEVLFLDEPTAGLDPQSRLALWDLVRELHAGGQTVLLTTHYMEEADQLCERLAIMDHGRILALDTPAELKRTLGASSEIRLEITGDAGALAALLAEELGDATTGVKAVDGAVRCFVRQAGGVVGPAVAAAERAGVTLTNVSVTEPTLESVFISLTGRDLRE